MARFEVFIPAADASGFNVTFRVDAANWMAALKTGLQKLGEQGAATQNVLVDIQDDESVHVTDPASGRVFRIRELTDAESEKAQPKKAAAPEAPPAPPPTITSRDEGTDEWEPPSPAAPAVAPAAATAPAPAASPMREAVTIIEPRPFSALTALPSPASAPPPPEAAKTLVEPLPAPASAPAPKAAPTPKHEKKKDKEKEKRQTSPGLNRGRVEPEAVVELEAPTRPVTGKIGREPQRDRKEQIEDLLAEVFERVQDVYAQKDRQAALYFLLDLALEKIPAEAGTVFGADASTGDLTFEAVRGPRAKELLSAKLTIPAGSGVAGFSALEGVAIALSDIQKDPRYYSVVAQKVNYTPKSVLCAPMMSDDGRTFGCLQILNRRDGPQFTEVEMGLALYIAKQAATYLESL